MAQFDYEVDIASKVESGEMSVHQADIALRLHREANAGVEVKEKPLTKKEREAKDKAEKEAAEISSRDENRDLDADD